MGVGAGVAWALLSAGAARAQSVPEVLQAVKFEQRVNQPLPLAATFRDEAGRSVALGEYFHRRPVILALVYYDCPMLCTFVLNGLVKGLKPVSLEAGRHFEVVVISFNPRETPELAAQKKAAYLGEYRRRDAASGWHFLTGEEASIREVTQAAGFHYLYDEKTKQYAHASGVIIATPEGKLFRYLFGIEYAPRDLRLGLVEASQNRIGTPVDRVMLYCFHYDPHKGKYGLVIMRLIQVAGTATVLALGTFLVVMFRRDRRASGLAAAAPGDGPAGHRSRGGER